MKISSGWPAHSFQHVAATGDIRQLLFGTFLLRQVLTGEDQRGRTVLTLHAIFPRDGGFYLVTWTPCIAWGDAQGSHLLNRLVRRAVFAP